MEKSKEKGNKKSFNSDKETQGEEPADDELMEYIAKSQIRVNYRKSLGKEYLRKSWDEEIKKIFKKKS